MLFPYLNELYCLYSCYGWVSRARLRRCRRGLFSHEPQCEPNAEGKFTCTMLRRSLRSLRSSNRTLLHIPLPPALHPHPDKSQPAKMAVLPHAADFLRVPVNPSLLIGYPNACHNLFRIDKSQPSKLAVLPHAADFLRVPVNPSLLICWVFSNASASLHFLGGILMYGSTLRFACGRAPCICYSINPSLVNWLFYRMPQIFFVSR